MIPNNILSNIPSQLRDPLFETFETIQKSYYEMRWEPAELNGGKFCEVVYSILKGYVDTKFPSKPSKPTNMVAACKDLETADANKFSRSIRIQIPRMLVALYEIRNNRGVGHIGGDVNPNHMDAINVLQMTKWIFAELIRHFHNTDTITATNIVDSLVERKLPILWEVAGKKRILNADLSSKDKTLALLYCSSQPVLQSDLFSWVEHSNVSVYRRDVLVPAHKSKLLEYDRTTKLIHISPAGVIYVETKIPLSL